MEPTAAGSRLLSVFDRVHIINLRRRADRLRDVRSQIGRLGLALGDRIDRFEACSFDEPGDFPTAGTRGCFHSHLTILQDAARDGVGSVLILEDDLDLAGDIEERLPPTLDALVETPWAVFYGAVLEGRSGVADGSPITLADPDVGVMGAHFIAFRAETIGEVARYLEAILERPAGSPDGGPMHVDGAYSWYRQSHPQRATFVANSDLGVQRPSRTDIHELGWKDRAPVIREVTAVARRVIRHIRKAS
jgi:hypothetical protein